MPTKTIHRMYSNLNILGVTVGFFNELPISTNFAVADIRDPDKRNASFSKTISIPGTKAVNILFEYAFEVNVSFQTFNPNLSTAAAYFSDTLQTFKGSLQILSISELNGGIVYNCSIIGTNADLFLSIGSKYLIGNQDPADDLDFSDLDHTLSYANFIAAPTLGSGYVYGYIDYGMGLSVCSDKWNVAHMKAAIWAYEYVIRIFQKAGKTFSGSFLNSTYFKSKAIPAVDEGAYKFSPVQITNRQFYAAKTTATIFASVPATIALGGSYYIYPQATSINPYIFNDDSTAPFNDPGGIYNTGSGQAVTSVVGQNSYTFSMNYTFSISAIPGAVTFRNDPANPNPMASTTIAIYRNGSPISTDTQVFDGEVWNVSGGTVTIPTNFSLTFNSPFTDPIGTVYQCAFISCIIQGSWFDAGGTIISTGAASILNFSIDANSSFYSNLYAQYLSFGSSVEMNNNIPKDVKQADLLTSIFKMFNLYIEQDKTDENNYFIAPRDEFIDLTTPLVWTEKHDISKETLTLPMGDLDAKSYLLTYKPGDKDYWNSLYESKFKETYGQQRTTVVNDFINNEKKIEVIFSPSPGVAYQNNIVAPRFLTIDGTYPSGPFSVKPTKVNIRILDYGGQKVCNTHQLKIGPLGIDYVTINTYPSLNHLDDMTLPTKDLSFSAPREVYWSLPAQNFTTDNLGNRYYKKFFQEITDPNSKIIKAFLLLNETDIRTFSFRNIVYLKGAYFFVNRISDYDPQFFKSIPVELLKLIQGADFTPQNYEPWNPPIGEPQSVILNPQFNNAGNYGQGGNAAIGSGLINRAEVGIITGNNSAVRSNVSDFNGIGINDMDIDSSYEGKVVLRQNGLVVSDEGMELVKLARESTLADVHVTKPLTFIDATAGNRNVILERTSELKENRVIRVDSSANNVTVFGFAGTELIIGNGVSGTSDTIPNWTTRNYTTDGTNYYY